MDMSKHLMDSVKYELEFKKAKEEFEPILKNISLKVLIITIKHPGFITDEEVVEELRSYISQMLEYLDRINSVHLKAMAINDYDLNKKCGDEKNKLIYDMEEIRKLYMRN